MIRARAALALLVAAAVAAAVVSGGSPTDPRTPPALPGLPAPFLGTAVLGSGDLTAAVDAYGDVIDLRAGPAGRPLIEIPPGRPTVDGVAASGGIVPGVRVGGVRVPPWRAERVLQRYRAGTNVLVVTASFGSATVTTTYAAHAGVLACRTRVTGPARVAVDSSDRGVGSRLHCDDGRARTVLRAAERLDRQWLARSRPLARDAPRWALRMYRRSLLALRASTDRRTGAVAAGAREGWAYVWPRDAGAVALAFAAAGHRTEARRVARFLLRLDLDAAARFDGDGGPVEGREAQGDAAGWVGAAARAANLPILGPTAPWRDRSDYWEGERGDYLGNALAAASLGAASRSVLKRFESRRGLMRASADPASGLDSAAGWAVRPFPQPALFPAARRTLLALATSRTRFGITPGEAWEGLDPWTAPTAWTAWSLAALGERGAALRLLGSLRRAATRAGALPERVDVRTGVPTSTTPLAWSHAFAILALRELWP